MHKPTCVGTLALLLALLAPLFVSTTTAAAAPATATVSAADETDFVQRLNAIRAANGLGPLTVDPTMTSAARDWAFWMADNYTLQHAGDITVGAPSTWAKVGENVGRGGSVQAVMDAFMASPGHAANVLDPTYTLVGVGLVWNDDGKLYTTHRFASVSSPPPAPEPTPIPQPTATPIPSPPTPTPPTPTPAPPTPAPATATPATPEPPQPTPPATLPLDDEPTTPAEPDTGFEDPTVESESQPPVNLPFSTEGVNPPPPANPDRLASTMATLLSA